MVRTTGVWLAHIDLSMTLAFTDARLQHPLHGRGALSSNLDPSPAMPHLTTGFSGIGDEGLTTPREQPPLSIATPPQHHNGDPDRRSPRRRVLRQLLDVPISASPHNTTPPLIRM